MTKIESKGGYEKPVLKFVSLQAKENVADPCWSPSVNMENGEFITWYYDPNGSEGGYFSFQVISSENNCGSVAIQITGKYNYPEGSVPTDDQLIMSVINAAGGNQGQPFKTGSGIQDTPGGMS